MEPQIDSCALFFAGRSPSKVRTAELRDQECQLGRKEPLKPKVNHKLTGAVHFCLQVAQPLKREDLREHECRQLGRKGPLPSTHTNPKVNHKLTALHFFFVGCRHHEKPRVPNEKSL